MKVHGMRLVFGVTLAGATFFALHLHSGSIQHGEQEPPTIGDVRALESAYQRWKAAYGRVGGEGRLLLALGYSKGLSTEFTPAHGRMTLDLRDGSISVAVEGLPPRARFDVWLIHNRPGPGRSVKPEPGDGMVRIGSLTHGERTAVLQTRLGHELLGAFELDLVVVTKAGGGPVHAGLLFGAPSLFQRVYHHDRGRIAAGSGFAFFMTLIPRPAFAAKGTSLAQLVADGERIFFQETFQGNGRTCGTCHPAENNLTIDPEFIATLPPDDPLFVAEFTPALSKDFENPTLMRQFGLILENVDGFDDLKKKFVMRGVPHTLAMSLSLAPASFDGTTTPPNQRTGWSGDGAPGGGTLREFAIGAVTQHFTKTLNRIEGVDFRLPTDDELDALEAFQLSLGRQAELDLPAMKLRGAIPNAGRLLFLDVSPNGAKCNACHTNAGANIPLRPRVEVNANFDTGVESLLDGPGQSRPPGQPRDAGFGRAPNPLGGFGNGTFNTPPLVETADTGPFFHNNAVATLEGAVAFYAGPQFNASLSANFLGGISLTAEQVTAVAAFLRVINALENIRSSIAFEHRAQAEKTLAGSARLLRLALADTRQGIRVLQELNLHPTAVLELLLAKDLIEQARAAATIGDRNARIQQAIIHQQNAKDDLIE